MTREEKSQKRREYYLKNIDKWEKYNGDSKEYKKEYYANNKDRIKDREEKNKEHRKQVKKSYRENNKENIAKYMKEYRKGYDKELKKKQDKSYYDNHREDIRNANRAYKSNRKKNDPIFRLSLVIRTRIYNSIINNGFTKKSKTYKILGCSFEEFKIYIESKFEPWMNWVNYGKYNGELNHGWDMDHIIPISSAKTEEEIIKLNNYNNFQPLCSKVNRDIKKDKLLC